MMLQERLYRWLLRAYPRPFRDEYADLMAQLFTDQVRDVRTGRGFGLIRLWLQSGVDVFANATAHRFRKEHPMSISYYPALAILLGVTLLVLVFAGPLLAFPVFAIEIVGFSLFQRRTGLAVRPSIQHPSRAMLIGVAMIGLPTALMASPPVSGLTWGTLTFGLAWMFWAVAAIIGLAFIAAGLMQTISTILERRSARRAA